MDEAKRAPRVQQIVPGHTSLDVKRAFQRLSQAFLERIARQIDFAWGTVYLLDPGNGQLRAVAYRGEEVDFIAAFRFRFGNGLSAWALERRKLIRLRNIHHGRRHRHHPVRSFVAAPILHGNIALGTVTLAHKKPNAFTEEECLYLTRAADRLSRLLFPILMPPA
jgi:putative methionine-R-sulfoxide reductase with GAF domain